MLRKLLSGFLFGAGFALAFVLIYTGWMIWALPKILDRMTFEEVATEFHSINQRLQPPQIPESGEFLGATSSHSRDFDYNTNTVLGGDGAMIAGRVSTDGEPVGGLRLRLALNGSVMSQWAVTDDGGRYEIVVPPGEYRIDGHELNLGSANQVLNGMIDPPTGQARDQEKFMLRPGETGPGLDLVYIRPVVKLAPTGRIALDSDIIARWEAYPGAERYRLQVLKSNRPEFLDTRQTVFRAPDRPEVNATWVDLREIGVPLEAEYFYYVEVVALDADGRPLSVTPRRYWESDFEVVDR